MVEQDDTLQKTGILRILRVAGRQLELQSAASRDLDLGEGERQALHIIGKIIIAEVKTVHSGKVECVGGRHRRSFKITHFLILHLIILFSHYAADAADT